MDLFIVQGSSDHLESLNEEALNYEPDFEMCWTCPATVKKGDKMLIYLLAPISAIVGEATFTSDAFQMNDTESEWFGKKMATYDFVKIYQEPISLHELRTLFPEWHWTQRPQGAVKIPEKAELNLVKPFQELIYLRQHQITISD